VAWDSGDLSLSLETSRDLGLGNSSGSQQAYEIQAFEIKQ